MKIHYLKIREKFLPEIHVGNKRHEYRLASPDKMKIKVGDTIVLISNQNRHDFVKVTVKDVKVYSGWQSALEENWKQDFKNVYNSMQEALLECYKFYTKQEVDTYGIVVFSIEPLKICYDKMSVLLDTNIIIKRESVNNASYEVFLICSIGLVKKRFQHIFIPLRSRNFLLTAMSKRKPLC